MTLEKLQGLDLLIYSYLGYTIFTIVAIILFIMSLFILVFSKDSLIKTLTIVILIASTEIIVIFPIIFLSLSQESNNQYKLDLRDKVTLDKVNYKTKYNQHNKSSTDDYTTIEFKSHGKKFKIKEASPTFRKDDDIKIDAQTIVTKNDKNVYEIDKLIT